jgi:asparagine synthase (glutamine-hydrolysing)
LAKCFNVFMSGIAAIIRFDGGPVEHGLIEKMTAAMDYRGPDGINHWVKRSVALGQCMLRTTSESLEEMQPLCNEDENLVLVMDGRVDNWEDLRRELLARGATLRSRADAELVLRAYEAWNKECLAHIDGDFAFVVWDHRRRKAFCARDHIGNKPFHYSWNGQRLIVASDLRPILEARSVSQAPNDGVLAEILAGEWHTRDETMWRGVLRLVPAHCMSVDSDGLRIDRYWSPPLDFTLRYRREEEYFERYREMFADCVRRASRSHKPVAYQVSGGLDSSAVFCMAEHLRKGGRLPAPAIKGYTWAFHDKSRADEIEYARAVGEHLALKIEEIIPFRPDTSWFETRFREDRSLTNYPNGTMRINLMRAMASDGCSVVLNGEGGDEWLRGGRHYYAEELGRRHWAELYDSFREDVAAAGLRQAVGWFVRHGLIHFLPRSIKRAGRRLAGPRGPNNHDSAYWLSPEMQRVFDDQRARADARNYLSVRNIAQRTLLMKLYNAFADHVRELIDIDAPRLGLEARSPMYSRRFVEFAFATPARMRLRGNTGKFIHIKALEGLLPALVAQRKTKADFSVAFAWQLDNKKALIEQIATERSDLVSAEGLGRLYQIYSERPLSKRPMWELWTVYACYRILSSHSLND